MNCLCASYSKRKGQLKIQQMAFVLVAIMIFFAMVSLFYFSMRMKSLQNTATSLKENEAKELVRKLAGSPEFAWTATDCASCIDLDKVITLKDNKAYSNFWNFDYLAVERVFPPGKGVCHRGNYETCKTLTLINKTKEYGSPASAYVSLCRRDYQKSPYVRCELGRIYVGSPEIK